MELENANKIKSQERRDMNIQDVEKVQNESEYLCFLYAIFLCTNNYNIFIIAKIPTFTDEAVNNQICMDSTNIVCASDVSSESASKDQMPSMSVDR